MKITKQKHFSNSGLIAIQAEFSKPFYCKVRKDIFLMRVKPTNFLLNSSLITDVINRKNIIVINIEKGTLFCMKGNIKIEYIDCELILS